MRDIGFTSILGRAALVSLSLALVGTGCAEDSTSPPSTADSGSASTPVLNKHRLTANGQAIVGPNGERMPIDPKQLTGYVDAATPNGEYIDLNGWVARGDLSRPADGVVAIAGKKSVAVTPSLDRPDVADGYDQPGLERSGYGMSVPVSALDCSAPRQGLRIFAVTESVATPVKYLSNVGQTIRDACTE